MRNRMYFADHDNKEFGVIVTRLPDIPIAEEDGEWVKIAGEDGDRFVSNGALKSVTFTVPIWVPPTADVNAVTAWLSGMGNIRFNNWPWFWKARVEGEIHLAPCTFNDGWTASPTFKAKPHRYVWPEAETILITESMHILTGNGTAKAKPIIEIAGIGDVTLMIGDSTILINELDGDIVIDCESKLAYSGEILKTGQVIVVDGVWPTLNPKTTLISWTGSIDSVAITPRWRCR